MKYSDMHIHTYFSPDSSEQLQPIIQKAVESGLKSIAITDHIDFYIEPIEKYFDHFSKYFEVLSYQKKINDIELIIGIEAGWCREGEQETKKLLAQFPFEYIINSIHYINGLNPYNPQKHYKREKSIVYNEYLDAVIDSMNAPYHYDTIGHLGYIERNATYIDKAMDYQQFKLRLDKIIDFAIKNEIIFEINTSYYNDYQPRDEFLSAYRNKGGGLVCLASDSHVASSVGLNFDKAIQRLKAIGFESICTKKNKSFVFEKI